MKYRAVYYVPMVFEFENPGTAMNVTEQARRLVAGVSPVKSVASKVEREYPPMLMETAPVQAVAPIDELIAPGGPT